jgi:hypothetical protein
MQPSDVSTKVSNILDNIRTGLDPDVFDKPESPAPRLKPRVRKWVSKTIYNLLKSRGWADPEAKFRLVLTGSLTTYQWSEKSDFDVSLFVEWGKLPEVVRADIISVMVDHIDGLKVPGTTHVLQCYVVPEGITQDTLYQAGLRSAYDLDIDHWIVPPERDRTIDIYQEMPALITYAKMQEDKMRLLLKYDPPGAKEFWKQVHKRRQRDQADGKGDFVESNIIYKWIANAGLHPEISKITGEYIA